ncbi:uncharacterized protein EI90DRAFT_3134529 [Cantharellus anzutake]|uniref:uncharacterized protein n=1 Tax=Cantharellus anzutake TaxID=1750568 RepID=UPI0019080AD4|nr:uncharacterized protein EI90DRAFT_3134529 [Cantharellus anzutake]KAF8316248.1 hypothetical protein EI90DRAFT_3134529 [Cantharellus anzutake]
MPANSKLDLTSWPDEKLAENAGDGEALWDAKSQECRRHLCLMVEEEACQHKAEESAKREAEEWRKREREVRVKENAQKGEVDIVQDLQKGAGSLQTTCDYNWNIRVELTVKEAEGKECMTTQDSIAESLLGIQEELRSLSALAMAVLSLITLVENLQTPASNGGFEEAVSGDGEVKVEKASGDVANGKLQAHPVVEVEEKLEDELEEVLELGDPEGIPDLSISTAEASSPS